MLKPLSVAVGVAVAAALYQLHPLVRSAAVLDIWPRRQEVFSAPGTWSRHVVVVGDLHGDLGNAKKVLRLAQVIDENDQWANQVDAFVQTGDIIDRGDDTIPLFEMMETLREQATAQGAVMLSMLGNHEVMNAIGDWRYVYPTEIATFGGVEARQKMLATGHIGRAWAKNYTIAGRLPLHPSLGAPNTPFPNDAMSESPLSHTALSFVHGGLSPTYSDLTPFPSRINEIGASLLTKLQHRTPQPAPHPPHPYPGMPSSATREEIALYESNGPLWYRGWALGSDSQVCTDVEKVLEKTGTRRMIMGHTPDFTGIVSRCKGKIIIVDTGISHAYGGVLSALSIKYSLEPIETPDGRGEQRWIEREVVTALYEDKQEVIANDEREISGDFTLS